MEKNGLLTNQKLRQSMLQAEHATQEFSIGNRETGPILRFFMLRLIETITVPEMFFED